MAAFDVGAIYPGWETVGLIGRGSFGAVYEIQRNNFGKIEKAALKVISIPQNESDISMLRDDGFDDQSITMRFEGFLQDIVREYSLMAEIKGHSNSVYVDDVKYIQHDDGMGWDVYIKMELLTPLTKYLGPTLVIPDEEAAKIGADISNMLAYCEKKNILHRDIKPQNIFMSDGGAYKLGDFGIAKTAERTTSGTKIGTFNYMAPEVYNNQPYGNKADIYSLGMTLYWLLNERRTPFLPLPPAVQTTSDEDNARARRFRGDQIPAPAHGSEDLKTIVLRACAFDPEERYQSAAEMHEDLENLLMGRPLSAGTMAFKAQLLQTAVEQEARTAERRERTGTENTYGAFIKKNQKEGTVSGNSGRTGDNTYGAYGSSLSGTKGAVPVKKVTPEEAGPAAAAQFSVSARLEWKDDNEDDRPESVSVVLTSDGVVVSSATLTAANDWSCTWPDLDPVRKYTASEQPVPDGYKASVSGKRENNRIDIVITNSRAAAAAVVPVKKPLIPLIIAAAAVLLIGAGILLFLLFGNKTRIVTQPESVRTASGATVLFSIESKGRYDSARWQVSSDKGITWKNVEGSNGESLRFVASADQNGCLYRCVLTKGDEDIYSDPARLEISSVKIPDVSGKTVEEAKEILTAAGLTVAVEEEYSDTVPEGSVISQDPPADSDMEPGSKVTITASRGTENHPVEAVSIDQEELSLVVGSSAQLSVIFEPENATDKSVTWKSLDESVATVDQDGNVTAVADGTAVIEVETADGGRKASCTVTVKADAVPVTGVKLNKENETLEVGKTVTLKATISPDNATDQSVSWSSSDKSVATVSSKGKVTAVKAGTATITVKTKDGGKKATCEITVKEPTVAVTGVKLNRGDMTLTVGESAVLTASVEPDNATNKAVSWSSSNAGVASVDGGRVTAKAPGTAEITVRTADGEKTAVCRVTVKAAPVAPTTAAPTTAAPTKISVTGVSVSKSSLTLTVGNTSTLSATVSPSNATDKSVSWSSSDKSIATVNSSGKVTAVKAGKATITVKTNDGSKKDTCEVTVKAAAVPVSGVSVSKTSLTLKGGASSTLTATVSPDNATDKSVTWSSSDTGVATVDGGKVTAKAVGTATIKVKTKDGGKTAECIVTVIPADVAVTGVSLNTSNITLEIGGSYTLTAIVSPDNATDKSVSWSVSDSSVLSVSSSGVVTALRTGTADVIVRTNDGSKTASCRVTVLNREVTYYIRYVSINGTNLGSSSVTYRLGTTNTISPAAKTGYTTPAAQTVYWDTESAKTITFTYTPVPVASSFTFKGNLWIKSGSTGVHYTWEIKTRNRTADSIEYMVTCTMKKDKNCYYGFTQYFYVDLGNGDMPKQTICNASKMGYSTRSSEVTVSKSSGWIKVTGLSPTTTSLSGTGKVWSADGSVTYKPTITIPTY
jgi:uncharacterized protein YjdB/serine/threonine protein kinase